MGHPFRLEAAAARWRWALILLFALGVGLRFASVDRPLDNRLNSPWREADYTTIARSFSREGMNILYPRVAWRGDTPGYVEMELPLLPWTAAALHPLLGSHERIMRGLSAALESGSLLLFILLATRLLPLGGALLAVACYALNPTLIELASSMQPEPVMLFFCLLAALCLLRFTEENEGYGWLFAACGATAVAMLGKATAGYMGLVIAWAVLRRLGLRALLRPQVYAAAALALAPPVLWYSWAHGFWMTWGMSIGMSNESHLIGLDMLWPPSFLLGIFKLETTKVFTPFGWLLAGVGLWGWRRIPLPAVWYGAVCVYLLAIARTSADGWAYYYHSVAVAPACLLMGAGVSTLLAWAPRPGLGGWLANRRPAALVLAALTVVTLVGLGVRSTLQQRQRWWADLDDLYQCSLQLRDAVPADGLIVVQGGAMFDEYGRPVAHNRPMAFAWMDRRGFNYGLEEASVATLEEIAARGGRYWVAAEDELEEGALKEAASHFNQLATCDRGYVLYDLGG